MNDSSFSWRDFQPFQEDCSGWEIKTLFIAQLPSTQDYPLEEHLQHRQMALILTDKQTQGRGRLNRTWESPAGSFAATLVIPYLDSYRSPATSVSLLTAAVLLDSLTPWVHEKHFQLRWPNDVYAQGCKLAGILLTLSRKQLRIGIGLNCGRMPSIGDGRRVPTTLTNMGVNDFDPFSWLNGFLKKFCHELNRWLKSDDEGWLEIWRMFGPWNQDFYLDSGELIRPITLGSDGQLHVFKNGIPCILTWEDFL